MKNILFLLLLLCSLQSGAQTTIPLFYEKAYLHTDRDVYTQGDDVWFKAYLLNAQDNKPISYSKNLYVELIGPGLTIIGRQTLRMEGGFGNGDLKLADTLRAGKYRLRAYTRWMRNFGDKFIFEKNIEIVGDLPIPINNMVLKPVKRIKNKGITVVPTVVDTLPAGPIVRFFPEGGYLINDINTLVAVKAEDEFGRGIAVTGDLIASSGRSVVKFKTDSTGMCTFRLRPDFSQQYHADVNINGQLKTFVLGKPLHKGFVLSVSAAPGTIFADVSCNSRVIIQSGGSQMVIAARHGGKTFYKDRFTLNNRTTLIQIPDNFCPEGIASIILMDEFGKTVGERLVYVHHSGNPKLNVSTDKLTYSSKEQVTVKIKLNDTTRANLSLAVIDAGSVPVPTGDILAYLTLRSEIKGIIEHPERYFDTTNVNRFKQLDMLLLTQGWRAYLWQRLADSIPQIKYDVEQGIALTGRVHRLFGNKPLPGMNITMFAPKADGQRLFSAKTDSTGRFTMDPAKFYGYQFFYFTSRRSDKINAEGRSKGRSGGWIQIDSLFQDRLAVHPLENEVIENIFKKSDTLIARKKFSFSGVNQLKTVQIQAKGRNDAPPPEVHNIGPAEHKDYGSLMHYLLYMIPGAHEEIGGCHSVRDTIEGSHSLLVFSHFPARKVSVFGVYSDRSYINYRNLCDDDYLEQPMMNVYKVTIFRSFVDGYLNVSVFLILKPGVLEHTVFDNAIADVTGYYKAREFYSPRYQTPNNVPDYRTTIHWEPNITTNNKGEATITYYNADPKTKLKVIVQGITDKGVQLVAVGEYEVK